MAFRFSYFPHSWWERRTKSIDKGSYWPSAVAIGNNCGLLRWHANACRCVHWSPSFYFLSAPCQEQRKALASVCSMIVFCSLNKCAAFVLSWVATAELTDAPQFNKFSRTEAQEKDQKVSNARFYRAKTEKAYFVWGSSRQSYLSRFGPVVM